jgi:hypothetical protein
VCQANDEQKSVIQNIPESQTQSACHHLTSRTVRKEMKGERQIKFKFLLRVYSNNMLHHTQRNISLHKNI